MPSHQLSRRAGWLPVVLGAGVCAVLVAHAVHCLPFLADDALISLRYTDRLLDGHGLTWTDGERVEGYSNPTWVLLSAVPAMLGMDLVHGLRLLGILCGMGTVAALLAVSGGRPLAWSVAALGFAVAGPVGVWTVGGLEAPLAAMLLAVALAMLRRAGPELTVPDAWRTGLVLAALTVTRPDGIVLTGAVLAGFAAAPLAGRRPARLPVRLLPLAVPSLAALALHLAFRRVYYQDWLPNTAYAKLGFTWSRFAEGWAHVGEGAIDLWPLTVAGLAGLAVGLRRAESRPWALAVTAPLVAWPVYVAFVGGDVFPAYRHLLPVAVLLAFGVGLGLEELGRRRRSALAAALVATIAFGAWQWQHDEFRDASATPFVRWGRDVALTLREAFDGRDPLLAVSAAGCLPYYSGFRSLDILGLCDRHIARNRPPDFGSGPLAHELGDAGYVLDRRPDILIIGPPGPGAGRQLGGRYDRELLDDPRFLGEYRSVQLEVAGSDTFRCHVWLRATDGPLGYRFGADRVEVPAYFCNGNPETAARLSDGRLVVPLEPGRPASLPLGSNAARIRRAEVLPAGAPVATRVATDADGQGWLDLTAAAPCVIETVVLHLH